MPTDKVDNTERYKNSTQCYDCGMIFTNKYLPKHAPHCNPMINIIQHGGRLPYEFESQNTKWLCTKYFETLDQAQDFRKEFYRDVLSKGRRGLL